MMQTFTNETIDLTLLPKYEEVVLEKPHPNYWKVIIINLSVFLVIFGAFATSVLFLDESFTVNKWYLAGGFAVLAVVLFTLYRASFKKRGFALREKDIIYKHGIIAETTTIIPLNRIQHVALAEGAVSRIYGLATLQIFTAGGASGNVNIAGIAVEQAKTIKEALVKRIDLVEEQTQHA